MIHCSSEELVRLCWQRNEVRMESNPLFPLPEGMQIDQIQATQNEVSITILATHPTSCCPLCHQLSSSIHSRYRRTVRDVPCAGRRVQLALCVRKFFCRNPLCERTIFTERLPELVAPWAKMTIRYCHQISSVGLATCGKGGTRLAARLGMQTSRQTILRRIMALPDPPVASLLYLGIDDFGATRSCMCSCKTSERRILPGILLPVPYQAE